MDCFMITVRCPVRISLIGGSSDLDSYLEKYNNGSVISFTPKLHTYVSIYKDIIGKNSIEQKYIVNYSTREEVDSTRKIQNSLVRELFDREKISPCSVHMTSDVFSHGSGLASSSSYSCGLVKAVSIFQNKQISDIECAIKAHKIEKTINPLLGQQDVFGCCIGGFKKIEFTKTELPKYTFLPIDLFNNYKPYLLFTGLTRNSTEVLKSVNVPTKDVFNPLVNEAEIYILNGNYVKFLKLMTKGWEEKKATSKDVLKEKTLKDMDEFLCSYPNCISHKLCGAGNGGFFLCFFPSERPPEDSRFFEVKLHNNGVERIL